MNRLRAVRLRAGLTQEALARRAGLTLGAVSQIEQGTRLNPRISTVAALARALGVQIEELLDDGDEGSSEPSNEPSVPVVR